ncbi:MAG: hypothetical protein QG592_2087 [Pseudomonadota bacterium]|nr:hypothetical protein [Pseudomonadota bacterium]
MPRRHEGGRSLKISPREVISQKLLVNAVLAVNAMNAQEKVLLADEIFAHQSNLLASVLVLPRMGVSLQQLEVPITILLVIWQAMKTSGRNWPMISEDIRERCLQRLTARSRFIEGLPVALQQRAVQDQIEEHGEPQLLAHVYGQLRENGLLAIRTDAEKYLVLAALNLVDCVAATAP